MKIGIALGSGAARGWAHIGILRALEERGIRPEIVAGSSVGALVGAAYASGHLDQLEQWVLKLDSGRILSFLDVSWTGAGLIQGDKLAAYFEQTLQSMNIEDLPKRFAAVATELSTGREIWFRDGSLSKALRASIALPGLFTPALLDTRYYIDGGLVNPVPVSLCRAMGAEIVIAVNLNGNLAGRHLKQLLPADTHSGEPGSQYKSDFWNQALARVGQSINRNAALAGMFKPRRKSPGMFEVIASAINIMQDRITRSRMAGEPPDIVLSPRLAHLGLMDFDQAQAAFKEGRACVERSRTALADYFDMT